MRRVAAAAIFSLLLVLPITVPVGIVIIPAVVAVPIPVVIVPAVVFPTGIVGIPAVLERLYSVIGGISAFAVVAVMACKLLVNGLRRLPAAAVIIVAIPVVGIVIIVVVVCIISVVGCGFYGDSNENEYAYYNYYQRSVFKERLYGRFFLRGLSFPPDDELAAFFPLRILTSDFIFW